MSPIQQMLLGAGAVAKKTYVDDLFNTFLYKGDGSTSHTINTGFDLSASSDGGMVWFKSRSANHWHSIFDTVRGANKSIYPNDTWEQESLSNTLNSFNNNGFTVGYNSSYSSVFTNANNDDYVSWSFRRASGFFDVVTYNGSSSTLDSGQSQSVAHSLGSVPGLILVKKTSGSQPWAVFHRSLGNTKSLFLNSTEQAEALQRYWNNTSPTSTHFTVGSSAHVNRTGESYVAYLFADGSSKEATSRSVYFDGSSDYLLSTSSDYSPGTGDFTMEAWVNIESGVAATDGIYQLSSTSGAFTYGGIALLYKKSVSENRWELYGGNSTNQSESTTYTGYEYGKWVHTAIVKTSGNIKLYINGEERISAADTQNYSGYQYLGLGAAFGSTYNFKGNLSNFKLTIGQALYTSAFTPTNVPLTTTSQSSTASNVKILCCNNSSVTGKTVGATITSNGTVTASTDNPNFIDPAASVFGDAGDQNVIKCGSYQGATAAVSVNLGWEPSWVMIKRTDSTGGWRMYDNMRGLTDSGDPFFYANGSSAETTTSDDRIKVTSTGFETCPSSVGDSEINNGSSSKFIFLALRRSDGYVGKPPELGTDVFAMNTGTSNSDVPTFVSGFPVDFAFNRAFASSENWWTQSRLTGTGYLITNSNSAEATSSPNEWDFNNGWYSSTSDHSAQQSWMWKRHAGFDVVTYKGNGTFPRAMPHSLNAVPEMIWVKSRTNTYNWEVYHKGLNGGTNPEDYHIKLNQTNAASQTVDMWSSTAPNATHYFMGDHAVNANNQSFIAMLFASVNGISKVGSYSGSDSTKNITDVGFTPRFIIIKNITTGGEGYNWYVFDTVRGWGSGNDKALMLDDDAAQLTSTDYGAPTSTGFDLVGNKGGTNDAGQTYIYYCHA